MKNLISMTDYLPEHPYSKFLKQHLELWMFFPCDEDGNVLEEPINNSRELDSTFLDKKLQRDFDFAFLAYQQAKDRCLFESENNYCFETILLCKKTIEDITSFNFKLTKTALKQIGL